MTYLTLKWIHVLAAVIALGTNFTYSIWLTRTVNNPDSLLFTLKTIKFMDGKIANPAYVISLLTGLGMVYVANWPLTTPWLLTSIVLYVLVVILGLFGYSPTLKQQIKIAEGGGLFTDAYTAVARRGIMLGIVLGILVVTIIFLMVFKPPLWG